MGSATGSSQYYRRALVLAAFLLSILVAVVVRLVYWQVVSPAPSSASGYPGSLRNFKPQRGTIFDSHGYLLAVASTVYDIGAAPRNIEDKPLVADRLSGLLGESRDKLLSLLQQDEPHVPLKRGVSEALQKSLMEWGARMLQADPRSSRIYPAGALAAHVLGFVTDDGVGHYGIEGRYQDLLSGEPGFRLQGRDPLGSPFFQFEPAKDGVDLHLTLDRNVQYVVEEELSRTVARSGARRGIAIVMEPATGAILALASCPTYDPNTRIVEDDHVFVNPVVSDQYEPGSVFKIVTMAAALDAGTMSPSSTYWDNGKIVVGGRVIMNSDRKAHGHTTMYDLLAESLNVGAAQVSTSLGAIRFYQYVRSFGFGQLSGVDLDGEISGHVRLPGDPEWHESDLGTNSFGQGIAVTPLQMISAVSAVANNGVLMRPYIVSRISDGGKVTDVAPRAMRRVMSAGAARQVTDMMVYTVDNVSTTAAVAGYRVAGKSGTSEVPVLEGYDPEETIASFAGFVPASDPRFALLVVVDRPQKEHWGGQVAGPAFQSIANQLVQLLGVPPDAAPTQ